MKPSPLALVALAYLYAATAIFGLTFTVGSASAVWLPSGIGLAATLLWGPRAGIAIFAGAFAANFTNDTPVLVCLVIASGNAAEALVGAALLRRLGFRFLEHPVDMVLLKVVGLASCAVAATVGIAALVLGTPLVLADATDDWVRWLLGDFCGIVLVTNAVLVWLRVRDLHPWYLKDPRALAEALGLVAALSVICVVVFTSQPALLFLIFPVLALMVYRFGGRGAIVGSWVATIVGVALTATGHGPFHGYGHDNDFLYVELYVAALSIFVYSLLVTVGPVRNGLINGRRA